MGSDLPVIGGCHSEFRIWLENEGDRADSCDIYAPEYVGKGLRLERMT